MGVEIDARVVARTKDHLEVTTEVHKKGDSQDGEKPEEVIRFQAKSKDRLVILGCEEDDEKSRITLWSGT